MRSEWANGNKIALILAVLQPANALACECSLRYGMRIGDVLSVTRQQIEKGRFTYKEEKTGKTRRVTLSPEMQVRLLGQCGRIYAFEHRTDWKRHRTRQAVYKDIRAVADGLRLKEHISPHSMRKAYAVERYKSYGGDIRKVQRLLNHSSEAVTMIYALADGLVHKSVTK